MSFFHLNVKEVHDFASEIAKDFEKLNEICERGETAQLISKIINILECLEASVLKIEDMEKELIELKLQNVRAVREKCVCEEIKLKLEQECEEIESNYEREIEHLKANIVLLQGRNKKLLTLQQIDNIEKEVLILDQKNIICKLNKKLESYERKFESFIADNKILNREIEKLETVNQKVYTQYQQARKEILLIQEKNLEHDTELSGVHSVTISRPSADRGFTHEFDLTKDSTESRQENLADHNTDIISQLQYENNDLQDEVHKLKQECITAKMQVKYYKERFLQSNRNSSQESIQPSNGINQLFHLFLGMVTL